ncbi:MAG TPA: HNH endonuclease signature motif containing protein [Gemmataceae bacterium]|nr:HNH endonuclease signature motif containing protein [Gemmataceae bacterium]
MPQRPATYRPPRTAPNGGNRTSSLTTGQPSSHRPTAAQRGYGYRWQLVRIQVLNDVDGTTYPHGGPLCRECQKQGKLVEANTIDHIIPHRGDEVLMWKADNLMSLCKPCHDRKTATTDRHTHGEE